MWRERKTKNRLSLVDELQTTSRVYIFLPDWENVIEKSRQEDDLHSSEPGFEEARDKIW